MTTLLGSLMGVNTASKVDTDPEQLEFTTILDKRTIEDKDSDVPVKFSELPKKDELYDVITRLETRLGGHVSHQARVLHFYDCLVLLP